MIFVKRLGAIMQQSFLLLAILNIIAGIIFKAVLIVVLGLSFIGVAVFGACLEICAKREIDEAEERMKRLLAVAEREKNKFRNDDEE